MNFFLVKLELRLLTQRQARKSVEDILIFLIFNEHCYYYLKPHPHKLFAVIAHCTKPSYIQAAKIAMESLRKTLLLVTVFATAVAASTPHHYNITEVSSFLV